MRRFAPMLLLAALACSDPTGPNDNPPATGDYRVTASTHLGTKVWDFTIRAASEDELDLLLTAGDIRTVPLAATGDADTEGWRAQFLGASFGTNVVLRIHPGGTTCEGRYFYADNSEPTGIDARPWSTCTLTRR